MTGKDEKQITIIMEYGVTRKAGLCLDYKLFQEPVTARFHYTEDEQVSKETILEYFDKLSIALRNKLGEWLNDK